MPSHLWRSSEALKRHRKPSIARTGAGATEELHRGTPRSCEVRRQTRLENPHPHHLHTRQSVNPRFSREVADYAHRCPTAASAAKPPAMHVHVHTRRTAEHGWRPCADNIIRGVRHGLRSAWADGDKGSSQSVPQCNRIQLASTNYEAGAGFSSWNEAPRAARVSS